MVFTLDQLTNLVAGYYWPFVRIGALFAMVPFFGARTIPVPVRILLAVTLTVVIAPLVEVPTNIEPLSVSGIIITGQQILIGLAMSLVLQMVFGTVVIAGQTIANTMGLGFAAMVDPQNGVQVPLIGQMYLLLATLVFLGLGGHLVLIEILVESFTVIPVGLTGISREAFWMVVTWGSTMLAAGVLMALPLVSGILLLNISFGVITRAAPQLNIFVVGFPISMLVGFILLWLTLPSILQNFEGVLQVGFELMRAVLAGGR